MNTEKKLTEMETFFMALADKTRLRLLNLMRNGEICVCFFVEVLKEAQPKISRHLAYLRNAGVVETRRDGKWMYYKIVEPENDFAARVLRDTLVWLDSQEKMKIEYKNLVKVCCSPETLVTINHTVKSNVFAKTDTSESNRELETFLL
jgi:ArsR family transcriptional regulator